MPQSFISICVTVTIFNTLTRKTLKDYQKQSLHKTIKEGAECKTTSPHIMRKKWNVLLENIKTL